METFLPWTPVPLSNASLQLPRAPSIYPLFPKRRSSTNPASLCLPVRAGADLKETVLEESKIFDRIVAGKERPLSGEPSAGTSDPPWQDQHSTRNLWFPAARFRANREHLPERWPCPPSSAPDQHTSPAPQQRIAPFLERAAEICRKDHKP